MKTVGNGIINTKCDIREFSIPLSSLVFSSFNMGKNSNVRYKLYCFAFTHLDRSVGHTLLIESVLLIQIKSVKLARANLRIPTQI